MPFAVFARAMINVAIGTQSFAFAGVLGELAADVGITVGQARHIAGAASITFALGAPIAAGLVAQVERRRVILIGLIGLAAINALCAFAPSYAALVALRIAAGIATAFVGALATVAAASLVPPEKRGRAFAIVLGGLPLPLFSACQSVLSLAALAVGERHLFSRRSCACFLWFRSQRLCRGLRRSTVRGQIFARHWLSQASSARSV